MFNDRGALDNWSAKKDAIDFLANARLKVVFRPAFQSVGRTRKQREREASSFAARLSRSLCLRSSYTDLTCESSHPPPLGPRVKKDGCFHRQTLIIFSSKREPALYLAKCELHFHSDALEQL